MGLDNDGVRFLLHAHNLGVSFAETAMVGRQFLLTDAKTLTQNLRRFGFDATEKEAARMLAESDGYAESFLRFLGARVADSFDASDYESATDIHDFNEPIPAKYKNKYSAVIDGGTLEHIFNFPTAIKNCMEMVKVGGHFLNITPTNNFLGHGFYQFSPELFFRIFTRENGYAKPRVYIFEVGLNCDWYEVSDPDEVKERVILANHEPSYLLVIAKKEREAEIFKNTPQQSDYSAVWQESGETGEKIRYTYDPPTRTPLMRLQNLPFAALRRFNRQVNRAFGMLNSRPRHFKKVKSESGKLE